MLCIYIFQIFDVLKLLQWVYDYAPKKLLPLETFIYIPPWTKEKIDAYNNDNKCHPGELTINRDYFVEIDNILHYLTKYGIEATGASLTPAEKRVSKQPVHDITEISRAHPAQSSKPIMEKNKSRKSLPSDTTHSSTTTTVNNSRRSLPSDNQGINYKGIGISNKVVNNRNNANKKNNNKVTEPLPTNVLRNDSDNENLDDGFLRTKDPSFAKEVKEFAKLLCDPDEHNRLDLTNHIKIWNVLKDFGWEWSYAFGIGLTETYSKYKLSGKNVINYVENVDYFRSKEALQKYIRLQLVAYGYDLNKCNTEIREATVTPAAKKLSKQPPVLDVPATPRMNTTQHLDSMDESSSGDASFEEDTNSVDGINSNDGFLSTKDPSFADAIKEIAKLASDPDKDTRLDLTNHTKIWNVLKQFGWQWSYISVIGVTEAYSRYKLSNKTVINYVENVDYFRSKEALQKYIRLQLVAYGYDKEYFKKRRQRGKIVSPLEPNNNNKRHSIGKNSSSSYHPMEESDKNTLLHDTKRKRDQDSRNINHVTKTPRKLTRNTMPDCEGSDNVSVANNVNNRYANILSSMDNIDEATRKEMEELIGFASQNVETLTMEPAAEIYPEYDEIINYLVQKASGDADGQKLYLNKFNDVWLELRSEFDWHWFYTHISIGEVYTSKSDLPVHKKYELYTEDRDYFLSKDALLNCIRKQVEARNYDYNALVLS